MTMDRAGNGVEMDVEFRESEAPPIKRNHALTAALIGGAAAATAGAVLGARAIARRNGAGDGKPLNSFMATACTASELSQGRSSAQAKPAPGAGAKGARDPEIQPSAHPKLRTTV